MHVTFAPPSSACVLVSISQPPNLYGFYMIEAFDFRPSPLGGYAAKYKACAINTVFAGRRTRTENLGFETKCSVVAKMVNRMNER
jgi:hypothetical protein